MRKYILTLVAVIMVLAGSLFGGFISNRQEVVASNIEPTTLETKTLSDIGNAKFAGSGAYYDDGMLKYASSGNTIGYKYNQSSSLLEFDIIFDNIKFPGWFSLTFKASGFDRTQSSNLTQKGYSFVIYASGKVEVWKPDMPRDLIGNISEFSKGVKYRFKVGAYNNNDNVQLYMSVNDTEIINAIDTNNPYLIGEWFNICGDGGTSARLFSTKKEVVPNYTTYTLSTLGDYPTSTASGVTYDKYKNINLTTGTVGWNQGLKDYSVEINMNWSKFTGGSNVWVAMRVGGFNRANSAELTQKGYVVRIGRVGVIAIYKNGSLVSSGNWSYSENVDYVFEFGCVDLDEERTSVFVNINGIPAISIIDDNQPIKAKGFFNINGDGSVQCRLTSVSTKLIPLMTNIEETSSSYVLDTYFYNTISFDNMLYEDFTDVLLDAILINNTSVKDINHTYSAINGVDRAIDVKYLNNKLTVIISKSWINKTNLTTSLLELEEFALKKTGTETGLVCPSGYVLKQTYYYSV